MIAAGLEFFVFVELDVELCAVIVRREDLTLFTDQEATRNGYIFKELLNVSGDIIVGLPAAVVPVEGSRGEAFTSREFKFDPGFIRIGLAVGAVYRLGDDAGGVTELQGTERHVGRMAGHVAQCAGAVVVPAAPVERQITIAVFALGGRSQPEVPVQTGRNFSLRQRVFDPLGPNRTVGPDMDLADGADNPGLDALDGAAQTVLG